MPSMHHVDACAPAKLVVCSACVASWQDAKITQYYVALGGTGVYARKFRNEITRTMHAGQER